MSDDNKDLGDDLNDMLDDAKEGAKKTGDKISQKASELSEDAKEFAGEAKQKASEFSNEAKKSAKEFSEGAKEVFEKSTGENKKILAGILAILLGVFGIHKFILGYNREGIIILVITLILGALTCGVAGWAMSVLGLIEGIIYLTKSDEEFYNTYQVGKKPWF